MEALKKNREYFYDLLIGMEESKFTNRVEEIHSIEARDGEYAIALTYKGKQYRLNSGYRPVEEAKKWAEQYKLQSLGSVISMYGLGNGLFAKALVKKMQESDSLLIYEPSADIFIHAMNHYDLVSLIEDESVSITVEGLNDLEFHNEIGKRMELKNIKSQIQCIVPQYDILFPESCVVFYKEIKSKYLATQTMINTDIYLGKKNIDNIFANLKYIKDSNTIFDYREQFPEGTPALLVAAGPSVEKNIEQLKRAKGKVVIFAVDKILEYLLQSGVEPDFVVTVDPNKSLWSFTTRDNLTIPLVCMLESNPVILDKHKGKKVISYLPLFLANTYSELEKVPPFMELSGSVATMAFTAIIEMGFEQIILVGQDLAYDGERSHAGREGKGNYGDDMDRMVTGVSEPLVKSRYDWEIYINWYQDILVALPNIKVIDAKMNGAKIKGTDNMTLEEALDLWGKENIFCAEILKDMKLTFNEEEWLQFLKILQKHLVVLNNIKVRSDKCIKKCDKLIIEYKKGVLMKTSHSKAAMKELKNASKFVNAQDIGLLIDMYLTSSAAEQLINLNQIADDAEADALKTIEDSKVLYEKTSEAAEYIKERFEKVLNALIEVVS